MTMREDFEAKRGIARGDATPSAGKERSVRPVLSDGLSQRFIGNSNAFNSIIDMIEAIAVRRCPVIITGETGVGKEMAARQIHLTSKRADKVFVPVDCTTLTGQLFESQLFGHTRGAFTGAIDSTLGFFRAADGGTIFLDEISEIPLELQAKLLRVLQENKVTPIGSTKSYSIDIRVICATNRDLRELVKEKAFRADLFYRLNVVNLEVPPLRERREDILLLAEYFLNNQAEFYNEPPKQLSDSAKELLLKYHWPGNVRELSNAMERGYVLSFSDVIKPAVLPMELIIADSRQYPQHELPTLDDVKRRIVTRTLEYTQGRKIAAAKILGIERRSLNRLIEKLNISVKEIREDA
ncbi:MAG: sigma-54-dependent Fis family transcriptional regulator [Sedimentisphaerales bacterium]|nr:sigma-54-dependent Fis family transcriptional regulator [Sedimentisphaerales bacterium]